MPQRYSLTRTGFLVIIGLILAAAFAAYFFFGHAKGPQAPNMAGFAMPVEAQPAKAETVVVAVDTVGSVIADEEIVVRPEIAGRVGKIAFDEGAQVKKGDLLLVIDDAIYAADLKQAEARLGLAQLNMGRAQKLRAAGAATVRTFDEANAELRTADAALALAKAKYDKTRITAPFDGIVGLRKVSAGDFVNVGQDIVNLARIDPLKVDFRVPETYLGQIRPGQAVDVSVSAFPGRIFKAEIYAIDPVVEASSRSVGVRAHLPNPDISLRPGQFANLHITLETRENAIVVPEEAIVPMGADAFVFTIVDGKAVQAKVTLGERRKGTVEIREGVKAGDMVITGGQIKIQPGMPVQVAAPQGGPPPEGKQSDAHAKPDAETKSEEKK